MNGPLGTITKWHFHSTSNEVIWPKKKIPIIFVVGANKSTERLEGKIRECLLFYIKIFENNSVKSVKLSVFLL